MARIKRKKITTTLTNGQTQYVSQNGASGVPVEKGESISWTVDHPGSTTTDYTPQISNMSDEEVAAGEDDWTDYSAVTVPQKTTAGKFGVGITKAIYTRARLKAVTSSGGAATTVRQVIKGPA